jgi:hypothetical protein
MQSADLLAGKEGTADPTELIELIEDLAELEEAGAGEFKITTKIVLQKFHVEKNFRKNRPKIDVSSSSIFCFIVFSGVSQP